MVFFQFPNLGLHADSLRWQGETKSSLFVKSITYLEVRFHQNIRLLIVQKTKDYREKKRKSHQLPYLKPKTLLGFTCI